MFQVYCMLTTPSGVPFLHHLSPLYPLLPPLSPFSLWSSPYCCLCLWGFFSSYSLHLFHPALKPPPSDSCQSVLWIYESISIFKNILFSYLQRERKGGRKSGRETLSGCLSQPKHVPWPEIELVTFQFTGHCSIRWDTPARAFSILFVRIFCSLDSLHE